MDSGWAVVVGAVVAFAGSMIASVFGPRWIASRDRKLRHEEEDRAAIRKALTDITRGLGRMKRYRFDGADESAFEATMLAITDLGLTIGADDAAIEDLATTTMIIVQTGSLEQVARGLGAWQVASHKWYRREIAASELLAVAKAEAAKDPAPTLRRD